jgi:hypothetical protein
MVNPKESGARTAVGPHNTIDVAMEDLPDVERRVLEKELKWGDGRGEEEKACVFPKNTHRGDQENRTSHHDYRNCYIYSNS